MFEAIRKWWDKLEAVPGTLKGCAYGKHNLVCVKKYEVPHPNPKLAEYGFTEDRRLFVCSNVNCTAEKEISEAEYWADLFGD
jgi:hypothetical protein